MLVKWEYYRFFKERVMSFFLFSKMGFKPAFYSYWFFKLVELIIAFFIIDKYKNIPYFIAILIALIVLFFGLDVNLSKSQLKTIFKETQIKEFYMTNSKYSKRQFIRGICFTEALWRISGSISFYVPLIFSLLKSNGMEIWYNIFGTIFLILIIFAGHFLLIYFSIDKTSYLSYTLKSVLAVISVFIGNYMSNFLFSCPLNAKVNLMGAMKNWLSEFSKISWTLTTNSIIRLLILFVLLCIYVIALRKPQKYKLYGNLYFNTESIGYMTIVFSMFFCGVLMGRENNTINKYIFAVLLITYTIAYIWDDIFMFTDELWIDSEGEKIYHWKNDIFRKIKRESSVI